MTATKRFFRMAENNEYRQIPPYGEVMEVRMLKACNLYANSKIDIRTISRTYNMTEKFFIKCIKKVYFLDALPEKDLKSMLERLFSEVTYKKEQLRVDFKKIDELKVQYKKLQEQKKKINVELNNNLDEPNNKKLIQNVCELDAKLDTLRYDKVFISF